MRGRGWLGDSARHSLSRAGIPNSFGYKKDFVTFRKKEWHDDYPDPDPKKARKEVKKKTLDLQALMVNPARVEEERDKITVYLPDDEVMYNFSTRYDDKYNDWDIDPDFLLDTERPAYYLLMITYGRPEVIKENQDLQDALMISIMNRLRNKKDYKFWFDGSWMFLDGLSMDNKLLLLPKLLSHLKRVSTLQMWYRNQKYEDLIQMSLVGESEEGIRLLSHVLKGHESFFGLPTRYIENFAKDARDMTGMYVYNKDADFIIYAPVPNVDNEARAKELFERWTVPALQAWKGEKLKAYLPNIENKYARQMVIKYLGLRVGA